MLGRSADPECSLLSLANWHTFISYSFGSDLFNNEGKPTFLEQPAIDALTFMADCFLNTKVIDPASLTMNQEMTANVFYNGSTAFFPQAWPGVYNASNDPSISQIVGEIEMCVYLETSGRGITSSWRYNPIERNCTVCDFKTFCPNPSPKKYSPTVP